MQNETQGKKIKISLDTGYTEDYKTLEPLQGELKAYEDEEGKTRLKNSMISEGIIMATAVWVDPELNIKYIWDGHGRSDIYSELEKEGYKIPPIPVVYVLARNKNDAKLKLLKKEQDYRRRVTEDGLSDFLNDTDLEVPDLEGLNLPGLGELNTDFLNDIMGDDDSGNFDGETSGDDEFEEKVKETTKLGDLWELGNHRLLCGDSTDSEVVKILMNKHKSDIIFTDPPYGMSYGGGRARGDHSLDKKTGGVKVKAHGMIIGDDLKGDDLLQMISDSISNAVEESKNGAAKYICFTWRTYSEFYEALISIDLKPKACIVWDKKSIGLGLCDYRPQHEFIFYCGGQWHGNKAQSDVWYMSRGATGQYVHPTQKPVELIEKALLNSSKEGDIVHDCFGGSGSTLMASEKTNRDSRLMELDPHYCDVIVNRYKTWCEQNGKKPVIKLNGKIHKGEF